MTRDGTAEPVSRDQILRRGRGQGKHHFPWLADHGQNSQPYPVDPYIAQSTGPTYITVISVWLLPPLSATMSRKLKGGFISPEAVLCDDEKSGALRDLYGRVFRVGLGVGAGDAEIGIGYSIMCYS